MHVRPRISHGWAAHEQSTTRIADLFPNQKSITVVAAAGTNQAGKDGHYKLIEGPSEETIPLIDSIDMSWEERRRMRDQHSEGR